MLRDRPELAGALEPSLTDASRTLPPVDSLPPEWALHIQAQPALADLLRPELREGFRIPEDEDSENTYRVFVYFDDRGEIADRYVGKGAGLI